MRQQAVTAALAVAARAGIRSTAPSVLHDGSNTLVHLQPAPVVARVATTTGTVRPGGGWLARELTVAGSLAATGAPVVPPTDLLPPGPHEEDGLAISFWRYVPTVAAPVDLAPAGRALRLCHDLLAARGPAVPADGPIEEACRLAVRLCARRPRIFTPDEATVLGFWAARVPADLAATPLPRHTVHGDAHPGNVLHTARGPLWNDWEDCFHGPPGWDLACSQANARVFGHAPAEAASLLAGYGRVALDPVHLDLLVDARVLQAAVWGTILSDRRGQRRSPAVTAALAWLRARRG
ncbi:hypothetical protein DSM112329_05341 [Paraconexibacter sp. AEG42_29]|uniref:Aminoglycoside phosphotransferase domain-containing protein n=1 Tax=Paraconexibacter sp. AEG42_29 TaxID=2997339 RepID=A0AAU7B3D5_9ACTN